MQICVCVCVCLLPLNPLRFLTRLCDENIKMSRKKKSRKKKEAKVSSFKSGAGATSPEDHQLQTVGRGFVNQLVQMVKLWALLEDEGEAISSLGREGQCPDDHSHTLITFRFN